MDSQDTKPVNHQDPLENRTPPVQRSWWLPLALLIVLVGVWIVRSRLRDAIDDGIPANRQLGMPQAGQTQGPSPVPAGETVSLEIDFGNGAHRQFHKLPWHAGMTVADLMEIAARYRPGLQVACRGANDSRLLTAIDGISGEGQGGRNWIFYLGKTRSPQGMSRQDLKPGDTVLWKYEPYE